MKNFAEYIKFRENSDNSSAALFRIIRLAWKNHRDRTASFLSKLASIDPEISGEYDRIQDDPEVRRQKKLSDFDDVRPPLADQGAAPDSED